MQPDNQVTPQFPSTNPTQNNLTTPQNVPTPPQKPKKKSRIFLISSLIVVLVLALAATATAVFLLNRPVPADNDPEIIANNDQNKSENKLSNPSELDFDFAKLENNQQNLLYSPLSIRYGLHMLADGASGETLAQIEEVLGEQSLPVYENIPETLSLANSLFVRSTFSNYLNQNYSASLEENYNAEVKIDPFKNATNINAWINEKTLGQIPEIVSDDSVENPYSKMILVNALAIDMPWVEPFDTDDTYGDTFYLDNGEEMKATTMSLNTTSDNISYYLGDDLTVVAMDLQPYDDAQLEFLALMPSGDLSSFVDSIDPATFADVANSLAPASTTPYKLIVKIPKFSFDYDLSLKNDLQTLGITNAFTESVANFTNMLNPKTSDNVHLYVSDALHRANIDFSEDGVKAAAVTIMIMTTDAAVMVDEHPDPTIVEINHPFLFAIRDKNSGDLWFVGTVYTPNSWEDDQAEYSRSY